MRPPKPAIAMPTSWQMNCTAEAMAMVRSRLCLITRERSVSRTGTTKAVTVPMANP